MLKLLKKGILTTIQDSGRTGHAAIGVNSGGVMDHCSYRILNLLLSNPADCPVIEMHFPAPEIRFEEECQFALTGADFDPHLNNSPLSNGKIHSAKTGDILKFKKRYNGQRCYLGIRGRFDFPVWLNSYSQNSALKFPELPTEISLIKASLIMRKFGVTRPSFTGKIRFVPEFEYIELNNQSKETMNNTPFTISKDSNRMGYRLQGQSLHLLSKKEPVSSAVTKGTIQLLPNGQIIILTADAQTTGGYPKLGYVCSVDLNHLAQLGTTESFSFQAISQEESVRILFDQEDFFKTLQLSINAFS